MTTDLEVSSPGLEPIGRRRLLRALAGAAGLLPLAACGVLPNVEEPLDLYSLSPKTTFPDDLPNVPWQIVVEKPIAPAGIDSSRIALARTSYQLEYFAQSAWVDNAPAMVQTLLIESFENTGKIVGVGRDAIGLRPDYLVKTDLREFQALYGVEGEPPTVWVRMTAKVVKMPDRRIISTMSSEAKAVAATGAGMKGIVDAFDDALGHVLKDIVVFVLRTEAQ